MRLIYFPFLAALLWVYVKVLVVLRRRDENLTPILGWVLGLGFFFLVPLTIVVLNGGYEAPEFYKVSSSHANISLSFSEGAIPFAIIWISLLLSFLTVILCAHGSGQNRHESVIDDTFMKKVILITTVLAVVDYTGTILMLGGIDKFLLTNWYLRGTELIEDLGGPYVLYLWFGQANQTVFTAAAVLYTHSQARKGIVNWRFTLLLITLLLFHIAFQGERIYLALYLISLVTSCWIYGRRKALIGILAVAPVLAIVFSAWAYFRNAPTEIATNAPTYMDADLGNKAVTVMMDACDGGDTVFLFHIINDFGDKYKFLYGSSYVRALSFMVPRSIYPDKAKGFAIQLAEIYEPGEITSFAATELGELYANFGLLSILLLPLLTLAILYVSKVIRRRSEQRLLMSTVLFLLLIWTARSTIEDNLITFVLASVLILVLRLERGLKSGAEVLSQRRLDKLWPAE